MRNARQLDPRQPGTRANRANREGRPGRTGTPTGRHRRPARPPVVPDSSWPAPAHGYLEATGHDEAGHLLLTVVPLRER